MVNATKITSPDDPLLAPLCSRLAELARGRADDVWPGDALRLCGEYGVFEWFLPQELGGQGWSEADVVRGYGRLSAACLTTAFVITQRTGACKQIAISENQPARDRLLPGLLRGDDFATVGISHLTTSRRHLGQPALRAQQTTGGWRLDGYSAWVTGAAHAQTIVLGAETDDGRQVLLAVPSQTPGLTIASPQQLVGLGGSATGRVDCQAAVVANAGLLDGPVENVLSHRGGTRTGGLQTSTLALGLAKSALDFLEAEAARRTELRSPADQLRADLSTLWELILAAADGQPGCTNEDLRARSNSLALRATQASLAAAKGAGYVAGHPAGRWCREALFFLVWSCPQPVLAANLCELAGLTD